MSALASLPMTIPTRLPARSVILVLGLESSDALSESSESSSLSSSDLDALAFFFFPEPDLPELDFASSAAFAFLPPLAGAGLAAALAFAGAVAAGEAGGGGGAGTIKAMTFCRRIATTGQSGESPTVVGNTARSAWPVAIAFAVAAPPSVGTIWRVTLS